MKKLITFFVILAMLALCACGNTGPGAAKGNEAVGGVNAEEQSDNASSGSAGESNDETEDDSPEATTEPESQESTVPAFSVSKLSDWGLAEPSFSYEFVGYSEGTNGPDLVARVYYIASADYATAQAYAELVANSGWGGFAPDPNEEDPFGYTGNLGDYKLLYYWEEDGSILISVTDRSVSAVWDDDVGTYVIPEYGEYGSYGEYNSEYMYG